MKMTPDIERLAREAGFYENEIKGWSPQIEAFARAVAEECAKMATSARSGAKSGNDRRWKVANEIAADIRAKFEVKP